MNPFYKASFNLGSNGKKANLEDVIETSREWILHARNSGITDSKTLRGFEKGIILSPVHGALISTLRLDKNKDKYFGLGFSHKGNDSEILWETTLAVKESEDETLIELCLGNERRNEKIAPILVKTRRPNIVFSLINQFGAYEPGGEITNGPALFRAKEVDDQIDLIKNYDRILPVVYMSWDIQDSDLLVDLNSLANTLTGVAHVIAPESYGAAIKLNDKIGKEMSCYGGAMRIYWPATEKLLFDSIKTKDKIISSNNLEAEIFDIVRRWTVTRRTRVSYDEIQKMRIEKDLRDKGDFQKLAETYMHDSEIKDKENAGLIEELGKSKREIFHLNSRLSELSNSGIIEEVEENNNYDSLVDAAQSILEKYPDRIIIHPRAKTDIEKSNFNKYNLFFNILEWLSTNYHESKSGIRPCSNLEFCCQMETGAKYIPHQHQQTMKGFETEYFRSYNGKKVAFEEHIKVGVSRDSEESLRVAFYWDNENNKVVVGFVKLHQKNWNSK